MAETPNNRKLEQLLQDYARQRRDAAGSPEMHPATRQMLQAEVKQQHGTAQSATVRPVPRWLARFWPRLTVACGVFAILAIVAVIILPPGGKSKNSITLAKLDETKPFIDARKASPALAPAAVPASAPAPMARTLKAAPAESSKPPIAAAPSIETARRDRSSAVAQRVEDSLKTQISREEFDAKAGFESRAMKGGLHPEGALASNQAALAVNQFQAGASQRYRNIAVNQQDIAKLPVLDEFTVEQNGAVLKVVDRDGSVYNGFVRTAEGADLGTQGGAYDEAKRSAATSVPQLDNAAPTKSRTTQTPGVFSDGQNGKLAAPHPLPVQGQATAEAQNYYFRVEGTNRSLNQRVVFTGNMLQSNFANTVQNAAQTGANVQVFKQQAVPQALKNAQQLQAPVQNNFINGRVLVGSDKAGTELNALSIGP